MNENKKRQTKRRYSNTSLLDYHLIFRKRHGEEISFSNDNWEGWFPARQKTKYPFNIPFHYMKNMGKNTSFVINPESTFKLMFDVVHGLFIVAQLITLPLLICFRDTNIIKWGQINSLINLAFYFECLVRFNTAYYRKGHLVSSRSDIAIKYLKTWFLFDIVVCFPFDWVFANQLCVTGMSNDYEAFIYDRIFIYLRTLQFFRFFKLKGILDHISTFTINSSISQIFKYFRLVLIAVLVNHYVACAWYYLSYLNSFRYPVTWIRLSSSDKIYELYFEALYFAVSTMVTVGYGDVQAKSTSEMLFCIIAMGVGIIIFSYIDSRIHQSVMFQIREKDRFMDYIVNLNIYMKNKRLPKLLRYKAWTYIDYVRANTTDSRLNEMEVLKLLSAPLREETLGITRGKFLKQYPVFCELYSTKLINQISKLIKMSNYAPEDILFQQGQNESKIFFITSGIVEIYHDQTNTVFKELSDDCYFGEIGFFARALRTAGAKCVSFCDLMSLSRDDLDSLIRLKPDAFERTLQLQDAIQQENQTRYSALGISCFLCNLLGHVAIDCNRIFEKYNHHKLREKWIRKKQTSKIFKLNDMKNQSIKRKSRSRNSKYWASSKFSSGSFRSPEELWKDNDEMLSKIKTYLRGPNVKDTKELSRDLIQSRKQNYLDVLGANSSDEEFESSGRSLFMSKSSLNLSATDSCYQEKNKNGFRHRLFSSPAELFH